MREVVQQLLDRIATRGECDVVADLAVPIPLTVIGGGDVAGPLPAPDLGEHNMVVVEHYLQYDADRLARLTATGVLASQQSGE